MTRKKKTGRKIALFILILGAIGGSVWWMKFRKKEEIITIQVEKAGKRDLTELVVATGRIQPVLQVKISPEVSGEITALPVKEGQVLKKGDLLMKIKPDFYIANTNSADANLKAVLANLELAQANEQKMKLEFLRTEKLFQDKLVSESQFLEAKTALEVSQAQVKAAGHQSDVAKASLARALEELAKTTIYAPLAAVVTKLNSQEGERVVGTATMAGTEVMVLSNLEEMEARVDIGEVDVVLIDIGQKARLEVDSFRDKKFTGIVTEIANTAKTQGMGSQQEATRFEVKIRIHEREEFRPGMSVTCEVETRYRTNVLAIPIQCVTTRLPKDATNDVKKAVVASSDSGSEAASTKAATSDKGGTKDGPMKPVEVVFVKQGEKVVMLPVKRGISDETHVEITDGLTEGQEVVTGTYKAINRDLEDGKKVIIGNSSSDAKEAK